MFIHFLSIVEAMRAVENLKKAPEWQTLKIGYGKDRCDKPINGQKSQNNPFDVTVSTNSSLEKIGLPPPASPHQRVIYLGNLAESTTAEDICNAVRACGPLYSISLLPEKSCAFLTFINAEAAQLLFVYGNSPHGSIVIKGRRIQKVTFAKDHHIPKSGLDALRQGASRNIYLGGINEQISPNSLRTDFSQFGDIEQIQTAFVNFCSVMNAVNAMAALKDPMNMLHMKYGSCKISYGKDRVSGEPKNLATVLNNPIVLDNNQLQRLLPQQNDTISIDKTLNAMKDFGVDLPDKPLDISGDPKTEVTVEDSR